jgi:hypothetical protein
MCPDPSYAIPLFTDTPRSRRRSRILGSSALLAAFATTDAGRSDEEREERKWQYEALYGVGLWKSG